MTRKPQTPQQLLTAMQKLDKLIATADDIPVEQRMVLDDIYALLDEGIQVLDLDWECEVEIALNMNLRNSEYEGDIVGRWEDSA